MLFCELEKDRKTFEYFKKYIQAFIHHEDSVVIDNEIQIHEIHEHLLSHGLSLQDSEEIRSWIKKNSKPFRNYLNTIKIIYLVWYCQGKKWSDITFEEFGELEDKINSVKEELLDKIF